MTKVRSVHAGRTMVMVLVAAFLLIPATAFASTQTNGSGGQTSTQAPSQTGTGGSGGSGGTNGSSSGSSGSGTSGHSGSGANGGNGGSVNQQQINQSCQINGNGNNCTQVAHQNINNNTTSPTVTRTVPVFRTQRVFSGGGTRFVQTRRAVRSVVLAHTGLDVLPFLGLGLLLVAAGTGTLVVRRRGGLRRFAQANSAA